MLSGILIAGVLVAVTVAVHAAGVTVLLRALRWWSPIPPTHFWPITGQLVAIISFLLLLHVVEILVWGWFYLWWECLPDAEAAFYFSGVTYSSNWLWRSGAGDAVAAARTDRGFDGHPHVRLVHGRVLRGREPHPFRGREPHPSGATHTDERSCRTDRWGAQYGTQGKEG